MTDKAISPLRQRMIEDMTIRRLSPKTQHDYVQRVKPKSFGFELPTGLSCDQVSANGVFLNAVLLIRRAPIVFPGPGSEEADLGGIREVSGDVVAALRPSTRVPKVVITHSGCTSLRCAIAARAASPASIETGRLMR